MWSEYIERLSHSTRAASDCRFVWATGRFSTTVGLGLRWVEETALPGARPLVLPPAGPAIGMAISRLPRQDPLPCIGFRY